MASSTVDQVQLVLRLTLGLIFLVSALAKLRDPAAFVQGVLEYRVLPGRLARVYGQLLPFIELGTALLLFSGYFQAAAGGLAVLMLISFAIAVAIVSIQGREIGCHCFGQSSTGRVGWHTLARDLLLLAPALWLLASAAGVEGKRVAWAPGDVGANIAAVMLAVLIGLAYWLVAESIEALANLTHTRGRTA